MRRECRECFPPPPISKETDSWRSRHASRHVRDARAVMYVGIAHLRWRGKRSRHSRRMRTRHFTYLARGPWHDVLMHLSHQNPLLGRRSSGPFTQFISDYIYEQIIWSMIGHEKTDIRRKWWDSVWIWTIWTFRTNYKRTVVKIGWCALVLIRYWKTLHDHDFYDMEMLSVLETLLWGASTDPGEFTCERASNTDLWCFRCHYQKSCWKKFVEMTVIWDVVTVTWRYWHDKTSCYVCSWSEQSENMS